MAPLQFAHRMREPETYPTDAIFRAPDLLATWLLYSPEARPVSRDWEDWAENAAMLHAAHAACGDVRIIPQPKRIAGFQGDPTPCIPQNPDGQPTYMYGIWHTSDNWNFPEDINLVGNHASSVRRACSYGLSETFRRRAGRLFHVLDADHNQIENCLLQMHQAGVRDIFVKTRFKGVARPFTLPESPKQLWGSISRDTELEWFLVEHEGRQSILYIQAAYEPTREYRMIVVGDKPVTGAGCIEAFTPVDNTGQAFDDRMEEIRNKSAPASRPDTLRRYLDFATDFAREWATEHGDDMIYSLDLSTDARTGDVIPVEVNPGLNLGLYACMPSALIRAVQERFA